MGMIDCPDCGKKISDEVPVCPNCGRPIASQRRVKEERLEKKRIANIAYMVFAALAVVAIFLPYSYQGMVFEGTPISIVQYNLWDVISTGATGSEDTGFQLFWHAALLVYMCVCILGIASYFIKNETIDFKKIRFFLPFIAAIIYALYEVFGTKYYKEFNNILVGASPDIVKCGYLFGFYIIIVSLIGWIIADIYIKTKEKEDVET